MWKKCHTADISTHAKRGRDSASLNGKIAYGNDGAPHRPFGEVQEKTMYGMTVP